MRFLVIPTLVLSLVGMVASIGSCQEQAGTISADQPALGSLAGESILADCNAPTASTCAPQWWARGEYVFWTIGTGKMVEMGMNAMNSDLFNGLLRASGKNYLDVTKRLLGDDRTGYRFGLGGWLDDAQTLGVEADFLRVGRPPLTFDVGRNVNLNPLARLVPNGDAVFQRAGFFPDTGAAIDPKRLALLLHRNHDLNLKALFLLSRIGLPGVDPAGRQFVIPYGSRDLVDGSAAFALGDQTFWALDVLGRGRLFQSDGLTVDGLLGYRRVEYTDGLAIGTQTTTLSRPLLPGTDLRSVDRVDTHNTYDGVLLGVDVGWRSGSWDLSVRASATPAHYDADVSRLGAMTITFPDRPRLTVSNGTYLRSSEIGEFSASGWTVISELGFRGTRTFGEHVALTLGSSFLYIPEAARAFPQLPLGQDPDRSLSGRSGSPAVRPLPPDLRGVFLMTLSTGLEFRY